MRARAQDRGVAVGRRTLAPRDLNAHPERGSPWTTRAPDVDDSPRSVCCRCCGRRERVLERGQLDRNQPDCPGDTTDCAPSARTTPSSPSLVHRRRDLRTARSLVPERGRPPSPHHDDDGDGLLENGGRYTTLRFAQNRRRAAPARDAAARPVVLPGMAPAARPRPRAPVPSWRPSTQHRGVDSDVKLSVMQENLARGLSVVSRAVSTPQHAAGPRQRPAPHRGRRPQADGHEPRDRDHLLGARQDRRRMAPRRSRPGS